MPNFGSDTQTEGIKGPAQLLSAGMEEEYVQDVEDITARSSTESLGLVGIRPRVPSLREFCLRLRLGLLDLSDISEDELDCPESPVPAVFNTPGRSITQAVRPEGLRAETAYPRPKDPELELSKTVQLYREQQEQQKQVDKCRMDAGHQQSMARISARSNISGRVLIFLQEIPGSTADTPGTSQAAARPCHRLVDAADSRPKKRKRVLSEAQKQYRLKRAEKRRLAMEANEEEEREQRETQAVDVHVWQGSAFPNEPSSPENSPPVIIDNIKREYAGEHELFPECLRDKTPPPAGDQDAVDDDNVLDGDV